MCAAAAAMTRSMGAERHGTHDICGDLPSLLTFQAEPSRRRSQKLRDTNEIAGSGGEHGRPLHQAARAMACPSQVTDGLDPAEQFFDAFPLDVADPMAGCRVERASIAVRRLVLFCETSGVQFRSRYPMTKSAVLPDTIEHESIGPIVKPGDVGAPLLTGSLHGGSRLEAASMRK
jgi:hypothetical protein